MIKYRCHECGQGWTLIRIDDINLTLPKFCPACGAQALAYAKHALATVEARCFADLAMPQDLMSMLYMQWTAAVGGAGVELAFIDWLKRTVAEA